MRHHSNSSGSIITLFLREISPQEICRAISNTAVYLIINRFACIEDRHYSLQWARHRILQAYTKKNKKAPQGTPLFSDPRSWRGINRGLEAGSIRTIAFYCSACALIIIAAIRRRIINRTARVMHTRNPFGEGMTRRGDQEMRATKNKTEATKKGRADGSLVAEEERKRERAR